MTNQPEQLPAGKAFLLKRLSELDTELGIKFRFEWDDESRDAGYRQQACKCTSSARVGQKRLVFRRDFLPLLT
jgi:hypothetical protein